MKPCRSDRLIVIERRRPERRKRIEGFSVQEKKQPGLVSSGTHLRRVCVAAKWRREPKKKKEREHITWRAPGSGCATTLASNSLVDYC